MAKKSTVEMEDDKQIGTLVPQKFDPETFFFLGIWLCSFSHLIHPIMYGTCLTIMYVIISLK